jgi:hypothetical protein
MQHLRVLPRQCHLQRLLLAQKYTGLGNGTHAFSVRATDAAHTTDATQAGRTWTVRR